MFYYSAAHQSKLDSMVLENTKKIDSLRLIHKKELEEAAETHAKEVARLKGTHLQELEEVTSESAKVQRKLKDKFIAEKAVLKREKEHLKDKLVAYEDNLATGSDSKSEFIKVNFVHTHSFMHANFDEHEDLVFAKTKFNKL